MALSTLLLVLQIHSLLVRLCVCQGHCPQLDLPQDGGLALGLGLTPADDRKLLVGHHLARRVANGFDEL